MTIVKDNIRVNGNPGENISVIPIGGMVRGVTLTGVTYPLNDTDIPMGSSLGISNQFKEGSAGISIKEGLLLVIKSKE
ncbi:motility associated factor glycosyltransferase family protein [Alkaliphilus metalliredigens]|uniref:hypothetical protein n=1 Tax=Alkaliphilus metalliredigens TaxID=208226 RepID=UPI0002E518AC|nr:hypothetical protein [Alkaliphilus metalliredigens]